ncbi:MAG: hypothetical protein K2M91_00085 [Lachnospiraceae bacterium]|nr:hypothetical protein [Lachnospiraceae bacterium]
MEMDAFAKKVKSCVSKEQGNYKIEVCRINKNNGIFHTGLQILEGKVNIAPIIYLDEYHEMYERGETTIRDTASYVIDTYKERKVDKMVDTKLFLNYEKIRKNIIFKLINTEKNKELLEELPHIEYMDMSIVFHCLIPHQEHEMASILVHNVHLKLWDMTVKKLKQEAIKNTQRLMPHEIKSMTDVLSEIMREENPGQFNEDDCKAQFSDSVPMYVLTNKRRIEGAACILYPNLIKNFSDTVDSNLYIIPSSIHELLLMPTERNDMSEEIKNMIREINDTQVRPEEVLSYSLYYYDREEKKISML